MCETRALTLLVLTFIINSADAKYIEGVLETRDNWAFLARFCFLSEEGQFEYDIEYNEDQGDPNLLLYYDTNDQWPAVYKSNKTCEEKEDVLNIMQNQIVNLTARLYSYRDIAGCSFSDSYRTTPIPKYTLKVPTLRPNKTTTKKGTIQVKTMATATSTTDSDIATTLLTSQETISTTEYSTSLFTTTPYFDVTFPTDFTSETYLSENLLDDNIFTTGETEYETTAEEVYSTVRITGATPKTTDYKKPPIKKRSVPINNHQSQRYQTSGRTVSCHNARRFRSSRERWWFVAVSNCNSTKGINIKYRLLMTNGPPGDYWHEHFSADEFYILPVLMAFSIAYSFLMLGIVMCSIELKSRQLLHTTYKIFVLSVVLQFFGIMFESVCYLRYAVTGIPAQQVKRLGMVLMSASEACFLLLLLLLAKGFTITRGRLPLAASVKLTIFMCIYVVTYITIFIYEAKVFDPGEVLYLYESPAGYGLIMLRVFAWFMFIYSTIFTLKHYPEKGNFYYPFNIFGTVWCIAGPAFILSANTYIDKWVRESVVCAVLLFISFGGHLMFLILTMPSVANKNFPYHVRTTQIGIMEATGNAGTSTIEQFSHHVYEPSTSLREQTVIIPLTRRTEEIFEGMYNQRAFARNNVQNDHVNEEQEIARDVAIQNVLNWSLAKDPEALEIPNFDRFHHRSSTASANSRLTNGSDSNALSRESSFTRTQGKVVQNGFDDYVKDVPVELFTISRMVVATSSSKSGVHEEHPD
ncbi:transmembrane protein 145-like [Anoplophora glabripennis]|uniref:transmembrane protein 145-like n=1 Tax=Anoplophora glabripennis TaxID=217634 RepID=UPI00087598E2|nr:transmembrane protein 145-like [Anoplophora glabripennis]